MRDGDADWINRIDVDNSIHADAISLFPFSSPPPAAAAASLSVCATETYSGQVLSSPSCVVLPSYPSDPSSCVPISLLCTHTHIWGNKACLLCQHKWDEYNLKYSRSSSTLSLLASFMVVLVYWCSQGHCIFSDCYYTFFLSLFGKWFFFFLNFTTQRTAVPCVALRWQLREKRLGFIYFFFVPDFILLLEIYCIFPRETWKEAESERWETEWRLD